MTTTINAEIKAAIRKSQSHDTIVTVELDDVASSKAAFDAVYDAAAPAENIDIDYVTVEGLGQTAGIIDVWATDLDGDADKMIWRLSVKFGGYDA